MTATQEKLTEICDKRRKGSRGAEKKSDIENLEEVFKDVDARF